MAVGEFIESTKCKMPFFEDTRCLPESWRGRSEGIPWSFEFSKGVRRIQTESESVSRPDEDAVNTNDVNPVSSNNAVDVVDKDSNVTDTALSSLKTSARHDLAMVFTCRVCETRSVKMACRASYENGIVIARCGGCNNLHLIADRLGWFGQPGSVEDFLAARGEEVKKGSTDTLNLTLEDLAGRKSC